MAPPRDSIDCRKESGRAIPAKAKTACPAGQTGQVLSIRRRKRCRPHTCPQDDTPGQHSGEPLIDRSRIATLRTGECDDTGPPEGRRRLPQGSPRQQKSVSQRLPAVQEHNVQIPLQVPVLESIVQQDRVDIEMLKGVLPRDCSFRSRQHGDIFEAPGDEDGLVTCLLGSREDLPSVGDDQDISCVLPGVAPAQHRGPKPPVLQHPGQQNDHGCLARASHGEIAHTDHREAADPLLLEKLVVKKAVSCTDCTPVGEGQQIKKEVEGFADSFGNPSTCFVSTLPRAACITCRPG